MIVQTPTRLTIGLRLIFPFLILFALLLFAYAAHQPFWTTIAARGAIFAIAAVSLSFLIGDGGLVTFGHAAPFGLGAYSALILSEAGITNLLAVIPSGFFVAAAFSAITGAAALRTRGVYFIMVTLAFAQMAYFTISSISAIGGDDGMALGAKMTFFGAALFPGEAPLAGFAIATLGAVLLALHIISASPFGRVYRAARENEARVAALGFHPYSYRLAAYSLAGGIAGIAGILFANQTAFVSPSAMNWHQSGEFIVMAVLAFPWGLPGAILGATAIVVLEQVLGEATDSWKLWLGLLIVLVTLGRGVSLPSLKKAPRFV